MVSPPPEKVEPDTDKRRIRAVSDVTSYLKSPEEIEEFTQLRKSFTLKKQVLEEEKQTSLDESEELLAKRNRVSFRFDDQRRSLRRAPQHSPTPSGDDSPERKDTRDGKDPAKNTKDSKEVAPEPEVTPRPRWPKFSFGLTASNVGPFRVHFHCFPETNRFLSQAAKYGGDKDALFDVIFKVQGASSLDTQRFDERKHKARSVDLSTSIGSRPQSMVIPSLRRSSGYLEDGIPRDIDAILSMNGDEVQAPKILTRKPTVKKSQMPILEGYLLKKKTQLGRPVWVKRYFKIHETLLLVNNKDTVTPAFSSSCPPSFHNPFPLSLFFLFFFFLFSDRGSFILRFWD